ncbi:hypothetical protein HDU92_008514, partial [Lobulomyces angularis]
SLYDVLRTLTPDTFDDKLKGNFSNQKIAMTSYESFLTTLFAPKKQKKLVLSNTIRTDGIRLQLLFFNIEKSALSSNPDYKRFQVQEVTRLKEVGKWTPQEGFKPRIVVGVDLGDRWPVAACAVNYDTKVKKHLKIRKGNLYSGLKDLRKETENRKINTGINLVEAEVSDVKSKLQHMEQLMNFYSSKTNLSHVWKSKKVQQSTYDKLFRDMLALADIPNNRKLTEFEINSVLFVFGDADFSTFRGLPSLHTTFQEFFIKKARALGLNVVGCDEHYTSQTCPICLKQLSSIGLRIKHCVDCGKYFHRDVAAAECK